MGNRIALRSTAKGGTTHNEPIDVCLDMVADTTGCKWKRSQGSSNGLAVAADYAHIGWHSGRDLYFGFLNEAGSTTHLAFAGPVASSHPGNFSPSQNSTIAVAKNSPNPLS